jgi:hypothetical protein
MIVGRQQELRRLGRCGVGGTLTWEYLVPLASDPGVDPLPTRRAPTPRAGAVLS